jgi:hypothetical protein
MSDQTTALAALDALASIAHENNGQKAGAVALILDELVADQEVKPIVRSTAADLLGSLAKTLKPPQPWPGLVKVAKDSASPVELRSRVFDTLGNIPRPDSLDPVLTGMLDKDLSVRQTAFNSWLKLIGTTPPAAPRPADPNTRLPAIPAEKTYEPRSNPNKAFVDDIKAHLDEWKFYLETNTMRGNALNNAHPALPLAILVVNTGDTVRLVPGVRVLSPAPDFPDGPTANPPYYTLGFEDLPPPSCNMDFNDLELKVAELPDGSQVVSIIAKSASYTFSLVDAASGKVLISDFNSTTVPPYRLPSGAGSPSTKPSGAPRQR